MDITLTDSPKDLDVNNFLSLLSDRHRMVFTIKCLESHEAQVSPQVSYKAVAFYQKILWESKLLSQLMIAHNKTSSENHPTLYFEAID